MIGMSTSKGGKLKMKGMQVYYRRKTGKDPKHNGGYTEHYVKWLEDRLRSELWRGHCSCHSSCRSSGIDCPRHDVNMHLYDATVEKIDEQEGGGYCAYFPLFEFTLVGDGETEQEALNNLKEVLRSRIEISDKLSTLPFYLKKLLERME